MSFVPTIDSNVSAADSSLGDVLLSLNDVSLKLGDSPILSGVTFDVRDRLRPGVTTGQLVGVLGPSGVGKTRLLRIIAGLDAPDGGEVRGLNGAPLEPGSVGVVFQNYPLLRHRTIRKNLDIAARAGGMKQPEAAARVELLLARFGLTDRADFYPAQLSGGQRQRVAIAQQLVCPRRLLLMDEPFSGLDPATLDEVTSLIVEVANMHELNTILLVTHDIRAAMVVSDTLLMLGRERVEGKAVPGARVQHTYDLVAEGLAWRAGVDELPEFMTLEKEIKRRFRLL